MSAVFDNEAKSLTVTVTGSPPTSRQNTLLVGWGKLDQDTGPVFDTLASITGTDGGNTSIIELTSSSGTFVARAAMTGEDRNVAVGALADDTWALLGVYVPSDGTGDSTIRGYHDGTTGDVTYHLQNLATATIDELTVGTTPAGGWNGWSGKVAELAIFNVADLTEADALMAELATTTADAATNGTLIEYWPLLSNGNSTVGSNNLTNNGSVAFDADHPSIGGGGGGTVVPVIILHLMQQGIL